MEVRSLADIPEFVQVARPLLSFARYFLGAPAESLSLHSATFFYQKTSITPSIVPVKVEVVITRNFPLTGHDDRHEFVWRLSEVQYKREVLHFEDLNGKYGAQLFFRAVQYAFFGSRVALKELLARHLLFVEGKDVWILTRSSDVMRPFFKWQAESWKALYANSKVFTAPQPQEPDGEMDAEGEGEPPRSKVKLESKLLPWPVKEWMESPERATATESEFLPWTLEDALAKPFRHWEVLPSGRLNLFHPSPYLGLRNEVNGRKLEESLKVLFEDGEWILFRRYLKTLFTNLRTRIMLVLRGEQGSGKSNIMLLLSLLFFRHTTFTNEGAITDAFNSQLGTAQLVVLDDLSVVPRSWLLNTITAERFSERKMRTDRTTEGLPLFTNLMGAMNPLTDPFELDMASNRRFLVLGVRHAYDECSTVWTELLDAGHQGGMTWLAESIIQDRTLECLPIGQAPETAGLRLLRQRQHDPLTWLGDYLCHRKFPDPLNSGTEKELALYEPTTLEGTKKVWADGLWRPFYEEDHKRGKVKFLQAAELVFQPEFFFDPRTGRNEFRICSWKKAVANFLARGSHEQLELMAHAMSVGTLHGSMVEVLATDTPEVIAEKTRAARKAKLEICIRQLEMASTVLGIIPAVERAVEGLIDELRRQLASQSQ